MAVRVARAVLALTAAVGCRALPDIQAGTCGNGVLEVGETCDGFAQGEATCRPPGAAAPCQLDCTLHADGKRPACPTGWGCAADSVCRRATGGYRALAARIPGNAHSLLAGDFDGDGRGDIVSLEPSGQLGATKFRIHYFDRDAAFAKTWASPTRLAALAVARVSSDALADIVFSEARLGVLLGQSNRTLISETYPSYFLPNTKVRLAGALLTEPVDYTSPLVVLSELAGELTLYRPDSNSASLKVIAQLPGSIAELAGELVLGDVFEDDLRSPCLDLVFAMRGAQSASVYSACEHDETGAPTWKETADVFSVRLDPPAAIDRGPLLADMDGDGHLDLLIGSQDRLYVAFGDGQRLRDARPVLARMPRDSNPTALQMPLAAGDITGDGLADLIYPSGMLLSLRGAPQDGLRYGNSLGRFGTDWSVARIADLNGNGLMDVVAASNRNLDIDFYNGTGGDQLNPFVITTQRPVEDLAVGDFDGDLVQDLAFTLSSAPGESNEVVVAFGNSAGPPSLLLTAARVAGVRQIGALEYSGSDSAGELFIVYEQEDSSGVPGNALAWLVSNGDRSIGSLVELTSFAADGAIDSVMGLTLTTGAFSAPDRVDALLLGSHLFPHDWDMWLMPDLRSRTGRPTKLGWGFDPRIIPITGLDADPEANDPQLAILQAAGDIDANGLDELLLAAPDEHGEHCLVSIARVTTSDAPRLMVIGNPVELDATCSSAGQLVVRDLDADGAPEIVLLTGSPGGPRSLLALWNDGTGVFSADAVSSLARADETPQALALFQPTPGAALALAYVTDSHVRLLQATPGSHEFRDLPAALDVELERGTGIAATDVDGDGIIDLAIADAGSIRVLHAELQP
jgi:hypothetical protein